MYAEVTVLGVNIKASYRSRPDNSSTDSSSFICAPGKIAVILNENFTGAKIVCNVFFSRDNNHRCTGFFE